MKSVHRNSAPPESLLGNDSAVLKV